MNLSPVEGIRLVMQRIWINKAQYADAERQFHIAVQMEDKDQMTLPKRQRKSKSKKNKSEENQAQDGGLTPYQGSKRCFGRFKCKPCNRKWASAFSWANMGQQCKRCNQNAYPYKQHKFEALERNERAMVKEHDTTQCEKCQLIRGDCRALAFRF